ncbi:MAG: hypothetical protein QXP98_05970 [Thermoproteus sp.]
MASLKAALRELHREYIRFSRLNIRAWQRAISGSISMSLWLISAVIAMSWYGIARASAVRDMFWPFLTYFLYSEPVWAAAEARTHLKGGVAEQILAARTKMGPVLLAWLSVDSAIWSVVDAFVLFAIFTAVLRGPPSLASPMLFMLSLPPLLVFSLAMGILAVYLMSLVESTWVVGLALQLFVPLLGGIMPPTALPPEFAHMLLYSPLQYVIAPPIYAGTGVWPLQPTFILIVDYILSFVFLSVIILLDKYMFNYLYLFSR